MAKINRQQVYEKYDGHCGYCGSKLATIKDMQIDHIVPKWKYTEGYVQGDMNGESNLMPSCRTCNHYKRGYSLEEFRKLMLTLHERVCSQYITKVAIKYGIVHINTFGGKFHFEQQGNVRI
jgi:hypothetical protein